MLNIWQYTRMVGRLEKVVQRLYREDRIWKVVGLCVLVMCAFVTVGGFVSGGSSFRNGSFIAKKASSGSLSKSVSISKTGRVHMISNLFGNLMGSKGSEASARDSKWKELEAQPGELATFGAGCYWGTEKFFGIDFNKKFPGSVTATAVGFMGGANPNPTYREVCSGRTGHVEVLQMKYMPEVASFDKLCRFFFTFHDPTTPNRQGNDAGTQYASVIFYHDEKQREIAESVKTELQAKLSNGELKGVYAQNSVATEIRPASDFFAAQVDHQQYLEVNPFGYCNHGIRFEWNE
uniref:peptide-methionine (S)-S-oxide reductase n=1 Tax=Timspurckia oligopyrenoides TaxID=708627 RepID=A0A7S0ZL52_9RHOD|mmetsp:Transcript_937/g.1752  ORF Transcript_937/g.1752 Transcript_937/m.1752 type:complete len:292 (+) Transcript_937:49-924(+)